MTTVLDRTFARQKFIQLALPHGPRRELPTDITLTITKLLFKKRKYYPNDD